MKRKLTVTVDSVEKQPSSDQNEPPKKKKKKKNSHKREDEEKSKTTKVSSLADVADTGGHNREQKKKKDKKKEHGDSRQKNLDKKVESAKEGEEDMEEEGSMNESHVDNWTKENTLLLINNIKERLPEKDIMMFKTRAQHLPWQELTVDHFTEEQCRMKYKDLVKKVRHFRTLEEILQDVEMDLNNPKQEIKKAKDELKIKKPMSAYNRFVKDNIGSMTQKGTDKFKILAAEYKELNEDQKQKYVDEYNKEKKVYDEEMTKLRQSHPELFKSVKKSSKSATTTTTKITLPKYREPVDLYVQSLVDKKKEEDPKCDIKSTEDMYRKRWESLNDTKKEKWIKKAETINKNELEKLQEDNPDRTFTKSEKKVMERLQGKPEKPLNAYNIFTIETLSKLADMPNTERMKEVGHRWRALSNEEREVYNDKSKQSKAEYDKKYKEFLERLTPEEREKEMSEKSSKTPRKKKKLLQGPMSAMMFFINEKKDEYAAEHPTMDEREIGRYLYLEFKNLSEEQKAKYTEMEEAQYTEKGNQTKITKYFSSSFCSSADEEQNTTKIAPVKSRIDSLTTTINLMSDSSEESVNDKTSLETPNKKKKTKKALSRGKDKPSTKVVKPNSNLVTSTPLAKSKKLASKQNDVFELKSDSSSNNDDQNSSLKVKRNKGKLMSQKSKQKKSVETSSDSDSDSDASPEREDKMKKGSLLKVQSKTILKHAEDSSSDSDSDSEEENTNIKNANSKRQSPSKSVHGKGKTMEYNQSSDSESSSDEEITKTKKTVQSPRKLPCPVKPLKDVEESSSSSESESSSDEKSGIKVEKKPSPIKSGTEKRASPVKKAREKMSDARTGKSSQASPTKGNKLSVSKNTVTQPMKGDSSSDTSDSDSSSDSEDENVEMKNSGERSSNKITSTTKPGNVRSKLTEVQNTKSKSPVKAGKLSQPTDKSLPSTSSTKGSDKLSQDLFSGSDSDDSDSSDDEEEKKVEKKTLTKSPLPAKTLSAGQVKKNVRNKKVSSDDSSGDSSDSDASTSSDSE